MKHYFVYIGEAFSLITVSCHGKYDKFLRASLSPT